MKYQTILADPPWIYKTWSPSMKGPKYDVMSFDDIANIEIQKIADDNCCLLLWATNPMLIEALRVMDAWGFEYKTLIPWVKVSKAGCVQIGLGYQVRSASEMLLVGVRHRGKNSPERGKQPHGVLFDDFHQTGGSIIHPRYEHSRKPAIQYEIAEKWRGPYLSLFDRPNESQGRPNWTFTGKEMDGLDINEFIKKESQ